MNRGDRGVAAALVGAAGMWLCACSARADVVANWNFNALAAPVPSVVSADAGGGSVQLSEFTAGLGVLAGTDVNAWAGDAAGQGLVITGSGQNGRAIVLEVRTQGLAGLSFSVAARRSASGFAEAAVEAWDGAAWRRAGTIDASTTQWQVHAFDLRAMTFLNDAPSARIRVLLEGATSGSGNIRLDNLRVEAAPVPAPGAAAIGAAAAGVAARRGARATGKARGSATPAVEKVAEPAPATDAQRVTPPSSVPGSVTGARRSGRARSARTSG